LNMPVRIKCIVASKRCRVECEAEFFGSNDFTYRADEMTVWRELSARVSPL